MTTLSCFKLRICLSFCLVGLTLAQLQPSTFYDNRCPKALVTIKAAVNLAVFKERRMGASLLRLHFHDCFVQGCDASVLLDDTANFTGERSALPNRNSLRGFNVIASIKSTLEYICPGVVSCADILAVAARDSVVALGGTWWDVNLGRRDSRTASLIDANNDLPAPFFDRDNIITAFSNKGFTAQEMVALSGAHTIGKARCTNFRSRIYNETNIDPSFAKSMQEICPISGGGNNLASLDVSTTIDQFDNRYFTDLVNKKGLLHSDQVLFNNGSTDSQVQNYVNNPSLFQTDFAKAMIKMGQLSPLTSPNGEIRKQCNRVN
ncbi:cationic peroxidase 1-like [Arachis stenosperma]|uniref:cationic peroxidase 1-like n=1 Tax=Arachis stenosperma TaxID=217475 RepID=UPI0025ACA80C|nr:cationic peroxidase 1-like [Arachis stenosperma]